jgi:outer membrane lipoprotein-sorting protein
MAQSAETVMEEAAKAYEQSNGITVQFTANVTSERQGVAESFEGTIQMKGDKFVLITPDTRTWYNGSTQWTYMPHADEVYISTPSEEELQMINPMILLRSYKKDYKLTYTGESASHNAKPAYDVTLTSTGKNDIEKIELQIEKATSLPVRMMVYMKNDMRMLIRIGSMQTGRNQPDALFTFNPKDYPDAIEIDLR